MDPYCCKWWLPLQIFTVVELRSCGIDKIALQTNGQLLWQLLSTCTCFSTEQYRPCCQYSPSTIYEPWQSLYVSPAGQQLIFTLFGAENFKEFSAQHGVLRWFNIYRETSQSLQQFSESLSPNGFINKFCKHSVKNNLFWWIVHWRGCVCFQYTSNPGRSEDDNSESVIFIHYPHFYRVTVSYELVFKVCVSQCLLFSHFCYVSWCQTSIQKTKTSWIHICCFHFQNWKTLKFLRRTKR